MLIKLTLLKKTKDRYKKLLKKIYNFIPSIFTFLNLIFGFISILKSFDDDFTMAALCIAIAAVMDFADGKIARTLNLCSYFGMELDSLSDAISFCLAPTALLYSWISYTEIKFWYLIVLFFYLCSGIARLAKFNLNFINQNSAYNDKYNFTGLPTTASALFIIVTVLSFDNIILSNNLCKNYILISIFILSLLMLSNLKFISIKNVKFSNKSIITFIILNIIITYLSGFMFIFFEFILYILFNIFNNFKSI